MRRNRLNIFFFFLENFIINTTIVQCSQAIAKWIKYTMRVDGVEPVAVVVVAQGRFRKQNNILLKITNVDIDRESELCRIQLLHIHSFWGALTLMLTFAISQKMKRRGNKNNEKNVVICSDGSFCMPTNTGIERRRTAASRTNEKNPHITWRTWMGF